MPFKTLWIYERMDGQPIIQEAAVRRQCQFHLAQLLALPAVSSVHSFFTYNMLTLSLRKRENSRTQQRYWIEKMGVVESSNGVSSYCPLTCSVAYNFLAFFLLNRINLEISNRKCNAMLVSASAASKSQISPFNLKDIFWLRFKANRQRRTKLCLLMQ